MECGSSKGKAKAKAATVLAATVLAAKRNFAIKKNTSSMADKEQKNMIEGGSSKGKMKAATVLLPKKKFVSTMMGEYVVGSVTKVAKNMKNKKKINPEEHGSGSGSVNQAWLFVDSQQYFTNGGQKAENVMEGGSSKGKAKAATVLPAKKKFVSTRMGEYMVDSVSKVAKNMKNKKKINPEEHGLGSG
ncbi:hypothetical protein L1987_60774 [Smallanthus sonchifolius]|uniref:Uncharacterized protein n=1 Tax=Smallanthus sonchifolius TaxID=185202 RepID=A0ACB9D950_9ASTR|nr:hypothetical protein L1987_60774 [Smallanthus sonchifolius]